MDWLNSIIKYFTRSPQYTGVNPDPRLPSELKKDWAHEERAIALPADPFGNGQISGSGFFLENQNGTSSCVPHAVGLALAIERKSDLGDYERISQMFPYRLRSNYPGEGSYPQEIFELYRKQGAPLYTTLPTPMTELEANKLVLTPQEYTEAAIFKGYSYYTITQNYNDIATIAGVAAQGHAVVILIYATYDEWARQYPIIENPTLVKGSATAEVEHAICVLPNSGFVKDGKRYVVVQDSAWFGGWKIRYVPEDFIRARCYGAAYWTKVVPLSAGAKPKHVFTKVLHYGNTGAEVLAMQQLFQSEGLLAAENVTGNFYGRTLAALHAFQERYANDILIPNGLAAPTDTFGPSCIAKANVLCA